MPSRIVLTLVLLGLCLLLGGGLYYTEHRQRAASPDLEPLSELSPQTVRCIRIQRQGKEEIEIAQNKKGQWRLTRPIQAPALEQRIQSILSVLQTPVFGLIPATAETRRRLLLEPARVRLWLNEASFAFGTTESLYARRYVLHAGRIHLIDDYLAPQLMQAARFFADTGQEDPDQAGPPGRKPEVRPASTGGQKNTPMGHDPMARGAKKIPRRDKAPPGCIPYRSP